MKEVLDDWEAKLLAGHERRLDLDGAGPTAVPQSAKKKKAPAKKRATRKKKVVQSDSDDEGGDALAENVPRAVDAAAAGRARLDPPPPLPCNKLLAHTRLVVFSSRVCGAAPGGSHSARVAEIAPAAAASFSF